MRRVFHSFRRCEYAADVNSSAVQSNHSPGSSHLETVEADAATVTPLAPPSCALRRSSAASS